MMLLLTLLAAAAASTIPRLAPPDAIEYGFCDGSPEPASIDNISVEPFPIMVTNGASVTLAGIIPIKIPCLEIEGLHIGSCTYDGDTLLAEAETVGICPTYFPEGQACALPLGPGVYGGGDPLVLGPIESIPDILLPFLKGTIRG